MEDYRPRNINATEIEDKATYKRGIVLLTYLNIIKKSTMIFVTCTDHISIQLCQYPKDCKFLRKENTSLLENIEEDIQEIPNHRVYFVLVVNAREKSIQ